MCLEESVHAPAGRGCLRKVLEGGCLLEGPVLSFHWSLVRQPLSPWPADTPTQELCFYVLSF